MRIQLQRVRLLGGEWKTVETVCISGCRATIDGRVTFTWGGTLTHWRLADNALSQLNAGHGHFDMYCTLSEGSGAPMLVAVVIGDDLVEPE